MTVMVPKGPNAIARKHLPHRSRSTDFVITAFKKVRRTDSPVGVWVNIRGRRTICESEALIAGEIIPAQRLVSIHLLEGDSCPSSDTSYALERLLNSVVLGLRVDGSQVSAISTTDIMPSCPGIFWLNHWVAIVAGAYFIEIDG